MILYVIIACEIAFWVFLGAGLVSRYLLDLRKLGATFLACALLVNLVLLVAAIVDLRSGATADFAHGLGAVYLGFTIAFGHGILRWADVRFAHRFAGGPPPEPSPKYGWPHVIGVWKEFGKVVVMWGVTCALLFGAVAFVGDPSRTEVLRQFMGLISIAAVAWFVFGPLWGRSSHRSRRQTEWRIHSEKLAYVVRAPRIVRGRARSFVPHRILVARRSFVRGRGRDRIIPAVAPAPHEPRKNLVHRLRH